MSSIPDDAPFLRYYEAVIGYLSAIRESQAENIARGAQILCDQIALDRIIHVFGVGGHSYVGSEEFFYRAGGLANISPIFDLSLSLAGGGQKSTMLERLEGYGQRVIQARRLGTDDVLIITSCYGMNACTIDAALEAKRAGCRLIAITSIGAAEQTPAGFRARHSTGKNLHDVADVTIDTHVPYGEVCLELPGLAERVGGTCNILQCFCINALVIETARCCVGRGIRPPLWVSANTEGGDERNEALLAKYTPRVKYL